MTTRLDKLNDYLMLALDKAEADKLITRDEYASMRNSIWESEHDLERIALEEGTYKQENI